MASYRNKKILFFIVGSSPTPAEQALIDQLLDQAAIVLVRTAAIAADVAFDNHGETADYVTALASATVPTVYASGGTYELPALTPTLGGYAKINNGDTAINVFTAAGTAQVETATVAGTITAAGTVVATVTSAGMAGSPVAVSTPVALGDTAAVVAGKLRTAIAAVAAIAKKFVVSGSTTAIVLTARAAAANDSTLNIATDNGTATGLTPAATSANTTAGVAPTVGKSNGVAVVVNDALVGVYTA